MPIQSKIFIVDDHPIFCRGLACLIDQEPDMTVCGQAGTLAEALRGIQRTAPHAVTLDIGLKGASGLELLRRLHERDPRLPVLVISMHDEALYAERVLRAGAMGYISKEAVSEHVVEALRRVISGRIYASAAMVETLLGKLIHKRPLAAATDPVAGLTDRQLEVFRLIGQGHGRARIAQLLHISPKTVGTYREQIKRRLHLADGAELVRAAVAWVQAGGGRD